MSENVKDYILNTKKSISKSGQMEFPISAVMDYFDSIINEYNLDMADYETESKEMLEENEELKTTIRLFEKHNDTLSEKIKCIKFIIKD